MAGSIGSVAAAVGSLNAAKVTLIVIGILAAAVAVVGEGRNGTDHVGGKGIRAGLG